MFYIFISNFMSTCTRLLVFCIFFRFEILKDTVQSNEKEFAFQGMCSLIERNPGGLQSSLVFFCDAVTLWEGPPLELRVKFGQVVSILVDHFIYLFRIEIINIRNYKYKNIIIHFNNFRF